MTRKFHKGLRIALLLTILFLNLGLQNTQTVHAVGPAPVHDDFSAAKTIDQITYFDLNVDTSGATQQTISSPNGADPDNVPCEGGNLDRGTNTVWYKYTNNSNPPIAESITVDTIDSTPPAYDTYIAVWTGTQDNLSILRDALNQPICNDDNFNGETELSFIADPGETYYIQVAQFAGYYDSTPPPPVGSGGTLQFHAYIRNVEVRIGSSLMGTYYLPSGSEQRLYYNVSNGPVKVKGLDASTEIVSAIRLQSFVSNTLYSFVETMGVPEGQLSHKYYFPTYNNTWPYLNSQVRFANLNVNATTIRVTIGGNPVWEQSVPGLEERRLNFNVSDGPVVIESLDPAKKIVAAIRLQSFDYALNRLLSFSETMGVPDQALSHEYYFPTYNNTWGPLNSQLRVGNLNAADTTVKITIGDNVVWQNTVPGLEEKRLYFNVSDGPVKVESLDPAKKIVAAIRLQSFDTPLNKLYSFVETMGVPGGSLSHKYYFPTYNNTWPYLNSQIRFGNLNATPTDIRVTIGGNIVWEQSVPGLEERRLYFNVSDGPVIIESLDPAKKIVAAIRLQSFDYALNRLLSFSETMGIPDEQLSGTYYFPTYNNTWPYLNSQLRFGVP